MKENKCQGEEKRADSLPVTFTSKATAACPFQQGTHTHARTYARARARTQIDTHTCTHAVKKVKMSQI